VGYPHRARKCGFECSDLGTLDERGSFNDPLHGSIDLALERTILRDKIDERNQLQRPGRKTGAW
jgi:hypothetical protein